ncbi:FtsK/SpoIIIE domain-containing protein [Pseudarthrobacter sp. NPDC058362]|uniref:FtsK/SpoIIIE domain-containing protein n=1 Tax=Pseudarthrobacter sp. NPDC058362 TaxID=3346458 RepID=UPI00365F83E7
MTLHCTLAGGPSSSFAGPPVEIVLEAPDGTPGRALQAELAASFGTGAVTVEGRELDGLILGEPPLVNGAVMVDGGERPGKQTPPRTAVRNIPAGLSLAVHSGPGAGTIVPLERGIYTLGRSGARILIQDPELSRLHARLEVTDSHISITDLDSANGTYVDGQRVRSAVVSTASTIRCGNTRLALAFDDVPWSALELAGSSVRQPIIVRGQPEPANRLLLLLTATLPLVLGVALALATGMWLFLAFAAASAGSLLVPLLTGRKQRRRADGAIRSAAAQDRERRNKAGPSLAVLMLSAEHVLSTTDTPETSEAPKVPEPQGGERLWFRLGEAVQSANVQLDPPGAALPPAGTVPVLLDPGWRHTVFHGTRAVSAGMIRALLMQVAGYPLGRGTPVVIHGAAARLPLPARYLPQTILTATASACRTALAAASGYAPKIPGILVLTGTSPDPDIEHVLAEVALDRGWRVLQFAPAGVSAATESNVELAERESVLRGPHGTVLFVPDLAPEAVFDTFCRRLAARGTAPAGSAPGIPASCLLDEILPSDPARTAARWKAAARATGLPVPVGMGTSGPLILDLQSDGPHLLVAGTTGSGKSELLRSFVASLALSYPPDRVNFLFIDFKGGSGLGPLAGLVHCTGLLTDLSGNGFERALVSLRAEVRFREQTLSAAGVPDLAALRAAPPPSVAPLPHLVIVIDEFRMLVDDHPEALRELMRIASIGRSLGIHLVMATQRPQGALTADIRANVTSSIALRVQSEMESVDVINHRAAAAISIERPGRAFLVRGTEPPREFQAASVQSGRTTAGRAVRAHLVAEYLSGQPVDTEASGSPAQTRAQAAEPLLATVRDLWTAAGGPAPRQPVAAPLPHHLPGFGTDAKSEASGWGVALGLIDLPELQCVKLLRWDPGRDGHLALIGTPSSGTVEVAESISRRLLCHPAESHAYVLDAGSGLQPLAGCPRTGAYVGLHELRRAVRVLERLAEELTLRLSRRDTVRPPVLVVIAGWGSWVSAFRAGPYSWAEELVHDLIRDGHAAGISLLLSGDRELVAARFTAAIPNRLYFPADSTEESRLAWPRLPAVDVIKGRAVAVGPVAGPVPSACQLYAGDPAGSPTGGSKPQLAELAGVPAPASAPFRVEPLPDVVPAERLRTSETTRSGTPVGGPVILLGVTGDEVSPASIRLTAGGVFAILGGPATGKTNVLRVIEELNPGQGRWLRPGTEPGAVDDSTGYWKQCLESARAGALDRHSILLIDDADRLAPSTMRDVADLHGLGHGVVFTAAPGPLLGQRVAWAMEARSSGAGLLLCPRSTSDGEIYGVRFDVEPHPPPGRAVLIESGGSRALQVALASYSAGVPPPVLDA